MKQQVIATVLAAVALACLCQSGVAKSLRPDPDRIVLLGHSMGDFMTDAAAAADPAIKAFAAISAADMAGRMQGMPATATRPGAVAAMAAGLADEGILIVTADDGLARDNDAFAAALRQAGNHHVTTVHLPTDHVYSDRRNELPRVVLQ